MESSCYRSAIVTTANELDNTNNPNTQLETIQMILRVELDYPMASPLVIGGGHVNANQAMNPGLIYDAQAHLLILTTHHLSLSIATNLN